MNMIVIKNIAVPSRVDAGAHFLLSVEVEWIFNPEIAYGGQIYSGEGVIL